MQAQGAQQQTSRQQMTDLSGQMRNASLAPEGESSAGPWGAAHSCRSSEDEEELSPPASHASAGRCARAFSVAGPLRIESCNPWIQEPGCRSASATCNMHS